MSDNIAFSYNSPDKFSSVNKLHVITTQWN